MIIIDGLICLRLCDRRVDFAFEVTYYYPSASALTANELKNAMDSAGVYVGYTDTLIMPNENGTTAELEVKATSLSLEYEEQSCPANSAGVGGSVGEGVECVCDSGYSGQIVWVSTGDVREYRGECVTDGTGATVAGVLAVGTAVATAATGTSVVAVGTAATTVAVEASAAATAAASSVTGSAQTGLVVQGVSSTAQGAATSVLAQMQLLALLSKVPGVYKRAPTFAATFRSSGWLNLQGIPGWWSTTTNSSNATDENVTQSRRLATVDVSTDTETSTDFYNCSLDAVSSSTSSLVPDQYADFMSAWFYTVALIFFLVLGQMVAFWVLSHCRPRVMRQFDREVASEMDAVLRFLESWQQANVGGRSREGEGDSPIELVQVAVEDASEAKELEANSGSRSGEGRGGGGGGGGGGGHKRGRDVDGDAAAPADPPSKRCSCFMKLVNQVCLVVAVVEWLMLSCCRVLCGCVVEGVCPQHQRMLCLTCIWLTAHT